MMRKLKKDMKNNSRVAANNMACTGHERPFGILFTFILFAIFIYLLTDNKESSWWFLLFSVIMLLLSLLFPKTLFLPSIIWCKLGNYIGYITNPIVMIFIYYFIVLPTGIVMRILNKDPLMLQLDRDIESYWVDREQPVTSMKNQF